MKKQNLLVLGIAVALVAVVFVLARFMPQTGTISEDAPSVTVAETPVADQQPTVAPAQGDDTAPEAGEPTAVAPADAKATALPQVEAYLVVSAGGIIYEPIPLAGDGSFTLKQDEHTTNTVHVTPTSVWMEHSSCDNQDCVDQGTVTLENMESRVLYNMIICLPNQVVLELHTPETLESTYGFAQE